MTRLFAFLRRRRDIHTARRRDMPTRVFAQHVADIEAVGCTNPECDCREARRRVLDALAASGEVPALTWRDTDDAAVDELLRGGR